jgi:hypothetical protein
VCQKMQNSSIHRLLPGRIREKTEYELEGGFVKQYSRGAIVKCGVSAFIPPHYPHFLPDLDGSCHSALENLSSHDVNSYNDGIICFLVRSGETKDRKKAKTIKDFADAVQCQHVLLYLLDSAPQMDGPAFCALMRDTAIWTRCTEFQAEASPKDDGCNDDTKDDDAICANLEINLKHLLTMLMIVLDDEEYLQDPSRDEMTEVCAYLCTVEPTLSDFFSNSIRRCNFIFNWLLHLPDLKSDLMETYRTSLLYLFAGNAALWRRDSVELFSTIKEANDARVQYECSSFSLFVCKISLGS